MGSHIECPFMRTFSPVHISLGGQTQPKWHDTYGSRWIVGWSTLMQSRCCRWRSLRWTQVKRISLVSSCFGDRGLPYHLRGMGNMWRASIHRTLYKGAFHSNRNVNCRPKKKKKTEVLPVQGVSTCGNTQKVRHSEFLRTASVGSSVRHLVFRTAPSRKPSIH
jgi:hypothetical protein